MSPWNPHHTLVEAEFWPSQPWKALDTQEANNFFQHPVSLGKVTVSLIIDTYVRAKTLAIFRNRHTHNSADWDTHQSIYVLKTLRLA